MNHVVTGSLQTKGDRYYIVLNLLNEYNKPKKKWISTGLKTKGNKQEAKRLLQQTISDYNSRQIVYCSSMKFLDVMREWLDSCEGEIEDNTLTIYRAVFKKHIVPYFDSFNLKVDEVLPKHLDDFYKFEMNQKGLSRVTVHKHHAHIHSALEYARKNHIVTHNVAKDIKTKWGKSTQSSAGSVYSKEQIKDLFVAIDGDIIETPIKLIAQYGLRRSEALGLKWDAIDFDKHLISIHAKQINNEWIESTKTEKSKRVLAMSKPVEDYLRKVKEKQEANKRKYGSDYHDDNYVCAHDNGEVIKPGLVSHRFPLILERNNLPKIRIHDLRHSAASNLLAAGVNISDVSKWLGHADITTTVNVYGHMTEKSNVNMANILTI